VKLKGKKLRLAKHYKKNESKRHGGAVTRVETHSDKTKMFGGKEETALPPKVSGGPQGGEGNGYKGGNLHRKKNEKTDRPLGKGTANGVDIPPPRRESRYTPRTWGETCNG